MHMRPSRVLSKLRAGEVVNCLKLNTADARVAEIAALAGFDCLWNCVEHIANDWSAIEQHIWAAKAHDVDVVVRVARGSYSDYVRPLELDAAGIMVPHLMGLADARNVVQMTRFHPLGRRAADGGNADAAYGGVPFTEYMSQANAQRFVIVQIEDPEPLAELDEIASLEGFDMLFFGPGDFSHSLGVPGDFADPRVHAARRRVAEAALAGGKFAGTVCGGVSGVRELVDMGYRFVCLGADVVGIGAYCRDLLAGFRAEVG